MIKTDPILAVKDVEQSARWYQSLFGCKSMHGGTAFDILTTEEGEVILCLHKWGDHEHPTMTDSGITPGNGLILYFRTSEIETIYANAQKNGYIIEREIQLNPNSNHREFSLRDPDGYYLTITAYHTYTG